MPTLRSPGTHLAAGGGQGVLGAVELEEHEPARRVAQVVDAGDGLLALVAALGQVHGGAEQVELVRDGLVVGFRAPAGAATPRSAALRRP